MLSRKDREAIENSKSTKAVKAAASKVKVGIFKEIALAIAEKAEHTVAYLSGTLCYKPESRGIIPMRWIF